MSRPADGYSLNAKKIPGVTTICNRIKDKEALIGWAVNLSRQTPDFPSGRDWRKVRDESAAAGHCAHEMIESYLQFGETRTDADGPALMKGIEAFKGWKSWWMTQAFDVIELELSMVSESYRYGGTIDALMRCRVTGDLILADWKTGNNVYPDVLVQMAGYVQLIKEVRGEQVDRIMVVNANTGGVVTVYQWKTVDVIDHAWENFLCALRVYNHDAPLKKLFLLGKGIDLSSPPESDIADESIEATIEAMAVLSE